MPFGERLFNMCTAKGYRPDTIVKSIGLSTATATKWKNGEALAKIAYFPDCSIDCQPSRADIPGVNR